MRPRNLDESIKRLEAQPTDHLDRRIDALLNSQSMAGRKPTMRGRIAGVAIAAVVLGVVLVGIPLFNGDHGNVWARARENARKISNYSFRRTMVEKSSDPGQSGDRVLEAAVWYISEEHGPYVEHYAGGEHDYAYVSYEVRDSNEWVTVYPATREYERRPCASPSGFNPPPRETALWLLGSDYVELGRKTVDGRVLVGIANCSIPAGMSDDIGQWHEEVWFDVETMLPASFLRSVASRSSGRSYVIQQDRFRYNVEFPPHVFERSIPDGYTLTVVNGLRLFSELAGGRYPRSLDALTMEQTLGDRARVQKTIETLAPPSGKYGYDGLMRAAHFFEHVVRQSPDYAYSADRVTPKDGNRVLMYWGDPRRSYQVIWGDLRAETLSRDQLIPSCYVAGDAGCLLDLVERDDGTRIPLLMACLGDIGDRSVIPALLRHTDLRGKPSADDPFRQAIETIRRREEQRNPSSTLLMGRLLYASGRSVDGSVSIGGVQTSANREGYFALMVPCSDPEAGLVGYAQARTERLFLWTKASDPGYLTIVLQWTSAVGGRVVSRAGEPQAGVNVGLCPRSRSSAGRSWPDGNRTRTDAEGRFLFDKVPIGIPLDIVIESPDKAASPLRVQIDDLEADQDRDLGDLVIRPPEE